MTDITCRFCGLIHGPRCPQVKAIEYHPDGTVKRVEYVTAADYAFGIPYPIYVPQPSPWWWQNPITYQPQPTWPLLPPITWTTYVAAPPVTTLTALNVTGCVD